VRSKAALACALVLYLLAACGCSFPASSYTYCCENLEKSVAAVILKEHNLSVRTKLVGSTFWVYLPLEDMFERAAKPEKFTERFQIAENEVQSRSDKLQLSYLIKPVAEKEKTQEYKISKAATRKINQVWDVLRRAIFSMDEANRKKVQFYYMVVADIKSGFEIRQLFYYLDIVKVTYKYISPEEYYHRLVYSNAVSPKIVNDREGRHVQYTDISFHGFLARQIEHRINMKFQKPEVARDADIDKEISRIVSEVVRIYEADDLQAAELTNLFTNTTRYLSAAELSAGQPKK
jgi:hypothetical protein